MTDVMPEQQPVDLDEVARGEPAGAEVLDAVDEQLIARLAGRAREGGLALTGEGGLLAQLTKRLVESALAEFYLSRRSSSAWAKNAEAVFRTSFARRNSATS